MNDNLCVAFKERTRFKDGSRLSPYIKSCEEMDDSFLDSEDEEVWADVLKEGSLRAEHLIRAPNLKQNLELIDDCLTMLQKWNTKKIDQLEFG